MRLLNASAAAAAAIALTVGPARAAAQAAGADSARLALISRARTFELNTPYVPPPGNPLSHHAAGFATIMCSAVFITGFDSAFAANNVGGFTAPLAVRSRLGKPQIDRVRKEVRVRVPGGPTRTARFLGSQGCVALPEGASDVRFKPVKVASALPAPSTQDWPMGDRLPATPLAQEVNRQKVLDAVNAAFATDSGLTSAFVVTWKGRIIGERYARNVAMHAPLESWSMGKSITATFIGILIKQGVYSLTQPAPIPEWQRVPNDPRAKITIADILHMSSGLRIKAPYDPDYDPKGTYPDHVYFYTGTIDAFHYAATRPLQWPPNTVGRYHNSDPVLANYLVRLALEKRGEEYLSWPQRALFDKLGIRNAVIETDPYGNFLTQGYEFLSARDWARLGNLYLQDGLWNGERILPEGWAKFVSTLAPAWKADGRPIYGGFFWINGDSTFNAPRDAYYMSGAGGQTTLIIPSHDLVVVRIGAYRGEVPGERDFNRALTLLMQAVPASR